jgi:hypothetical protein
MSTAWHDIRFALRLLGPLQVFAILAIVSLGIAIAATTTIFSVVYNVLLAPTAF